MPFSVNSTFEQIADGIAEHGYAIAEHFLNAEEVDEIVSINEFQDWLTYFRKAGIGKDHGRQINESVRGDYIKWIDNHSPPEAMTTYVKKLKHLIQYINQSLFLSLKDYEVHMTVYPPGAFYKRHLDQFSREDHRKLSVICYLNNDWLPDYGGHLRMWLSDKSIDVLPTAGRFVCFRSDLIEHEVLPATLPRLSITGWILDQLHL
jgi:SM-20-related protein